MNHPPKPPSREAVTTLYQHSLRLQAALLKSLEQIKNEDSQDIHKHLAEADGHIERLAAELSNIRINHTIG